MTSDVTRLLAAMNDDPQSRSALFEVVYSDLRRIAEGHMRGERREHTLQATALVSEVYLRLVGNRALSFADRRHFFRTATEAMRRILVDHARARLTEKRGGARRRQPLLDEDAAGAVEPEYVLAVDDALQRLAVEDDRAAQLVRLRFFGGLPLERAAELLDVSPRTAKRDWAFARARLTQLIEEQDA